MGRKWGDCQRRCTWGGYPITGLRNWSLRGENGHPCLSYFLKFKESRTLVCPSPKPQAENSRLFSWDHHLALTFAVVWGVMLGQKESSRGQGGTNVSPSLVKHHYTTPVVVAFRFTGCLKLFPWRQMCSWLRPLNLSVFSSLLSRIPMTSFPWQWTP